MNVSHLSDTNRNRSEQTCFRPPYAVLTHPDACISFAGVLGLAAQLTERSSHSKSSGASFDIICCTTTTTSFCLNARLTKPVVRLCVIMNVTHYTRADRRVEDGLPIIMFVTQSAAHQFSDCSDFTTNDRLDHPEKRVFLGQSDCEIEGV